jgi:hypothetical protein
MKASDGAAHAHDSPEAARQTTRHRIASAPVRSAENGGSAGIGCRGTQARVQVSAVVRRAASARVVSVQHARASSVQAGSAVSRFHQNATYDKTGLVSRLAVGGGRRAGSRGSGRPEVRPLQARASYAQCRRGHASCQLPPLRSGTASPPAWRPSTSTSSLPIIRSVWTWARLTPMPRSSSSERPSGRSSKAPRMEAP